MMMSKNPTVVFAEPKKVVIEDRDIPSPQGGELLIETQCTLISTGTELTILNGEFPKVSRWADYGKFPFVAGYNNIGRVVEVGKGVEKNWIGSKVATFRPHAKYVLFNAADTQPIQHENVPDEQGAFFHIMLFSMNSVRRSNVRMGEVVVVFGLGLLGQFAVRLCRLCGARPVIAVDLTQSRIDMLGGDSGIIGVNPSRDDVVAITKEATKGRMADVAFEVTGNPELIPQEIEVLRKQGRLMLLSSPTGPTKQFDFHDLCNSPSISIIGTHTSSHPPVETPDNPWTRKRHVELYYDLLAAKELDVEPLITHREHYTKAVELYQMLLEDRSQAMGVVLDWTK